MIPGAPGECTPPGLAVVFAAPMVASTVDQPGDPSTVRVL